MGGRRRVLQSRVQLNIDAQATDYSIGASATLLYRYLCVCVCVKRQVVFLLSFPFLPLSLSSHTLWHGVHSTRYMGIFSFFLFAVDLLLLAY